MITLLSSSDTFLFKLCRILSSSLRQERSGLGSSGSTSVSRVSIRMTFECGVTEIDVFAFKSVLLISSVVDEENDLLVFCELRLYFGTHEQSKLLNFRFK